MKKIRIDKYKHAIDLHIGRLGIEVGWFSGDELRLCKIDIFNYYAVYPKALYILSIVVVYFGVTIWIDL